MLRDYLYQGDPGTHSLGPFVGARGANGGYGLMISEGPMARTVADVKAAYEVLVGGTLATPSVLMRAAAAFLRTEAGGAGHGGPGRSLAQGLHRGG